MNFKLIKMPLLDQSQEQDVQITPGHCISNTEINALGKK